MGEDDKQPWQVSGTTVYRLRSTGRRRKGVLERENEFTIQVTQSFSFGDPYGAPAQKLAQKIAEMLNAADVGHEESDAGGV